MSGKWSDSRRAGGVETGSWRYTGAQQEAVGQWEGGTDTGIEWYASHSTIVSKNLVRSSCGDIVLQVQELYEDIDHFQEINGQLQAQIQTQNY